MVTAVVVTVVVIMVVVATMVVEVVEIDSFFNKKTLVFYKCFLFFNI